MIGALGGNEENMNNNTDPIRFVGLRMPQSLKLELCRLASISRRSLSNYIVARLIDEVIIEPKLEQCPHDQTQPNLGRAKRAKAKAGKAPVSPG